MNRQLLFTLSHLHVLAFRSDAESDLFQITFGDYAVDLPPSFVSTNIVGTAEFELDTDGLLYARHVIVDANYQRQGIATAMYNFIEACYKTKIKPARLQTKDAERFWEDRNEKTRTTEQ